MTFIESDDPVWNQKEQVVFPIGDRPRSYPKRWWEELHGASYVPYEFRSNGCTASPDQFGKYVIWPACRIHDWHYDSDSGFKGRVKADWYLMRNIQICLRQQRAPRRLRWTVPFVYWRVVGRAGPLFWKR